MMEKILRGTIIVGAFAVLLIPFFVTESMFFPYITGKNFAFRIIVEVMLAAWLGLLLVNSTYRPKRSWIFVAMAIFTLVVAAADIFGENPARSFWSNFERMEGLLAILHLAAYVVVLGTVVRTEKLWKVLMQASIGVATVLAIFSFRELTPSFPGELIRVDATFGNPTYFAVYLLFNIFLTAVLAYRASRQKLLVGGYAFATLLQMIALYNTGTRGTLLGIIGGALVTACLIAIFGKKHPRLRRSATVCVGVIILLGGLFFAARKTTFVQESPILARFANISLTDTTVESRVTLWTSIGWNGFKERPLLGWGQDNFIVVFGKYYDPVMYKQEPWFDRAHNVFIDWAIAGGILGLLAYLSLFAACLLMLVRSTLPLPEKAILVGLLVAYGIHNLFVFDNLVSYIYFAILLSYIHARRTYIEIPETKNNAPIGTSMRPSVVMIGSAVCALALIYFVNVPHIARAQALLQAIIFDYAKDYESMYVMYDSALAGSGTGSNEAREQIVHGTIHAFENNAPEETQNRLFARAHAEVEKSIAEDPNNTRPRFFLGYLLTKTGFPEEGIAAYEEALAINPTRQNFIYEIARTHLAMGRFDDVITTFKAAYDVAPENEQALAYYAGALIFDGQVAAGEKLLIDQLGTTTVDNPILLNAYNKQGMLVRIAPILKFRLEEMAPRDDAQTRFSLALIYIQLNDRGNAIEQLERAIELDPQLATQGQPMLDALRAGKSVKLK